MSPLYWGIGALGLLSVLFEPLREALWELGEAVGGVGGVGGLTNQYGPTPTCNTTEDLIGTCLLYTSPSPRDGLLSRMPSSA